MSGCEICVLVSARPSRLRARDQLRPRSHRAKRWNARGFREVHHKGSAGDCGDAMHGRVYVDALSRPALDDLSRPMPRYSVGSSHAGLSDRVHGVRVARGRVVRGTIRTRARFPEGARLTLIQHDDRPPISLDPSDEAAIVQGIEEIELGRGVPWSRLRTPLRKR